MGKPPRLALRLQDEPASRGGPSSWHSGEVDTEGIPTGRVSLEGVIELAIEMGAEPIRVDHRSVLAESREKFEQWRTWGQ
jgi:hypothetical protein